MPRKPKPGPTVLRIETLSDGRPQHVGPPIVSDFDGSIIEPALPYGPYKPLATGLELAAKQERERLEQARLLIEVLMPQRVQWTPLLPQARAEYKVEPKPKPLAHNEHKLGQHVMVLPKRPLRRI